MSFSKGLVILILLMPFGSWATAPYNPTQAPLCGIENDQTVAYISPMYFEAQETVAVIQTLVRSYFASTRSASPNLTEVENQLQNFRTLVTDTIELTWRDFPGLTLNLISAYFYAVDEYMRLKLKSPGHTAQALKQISERFALKLNQSQYLATFTLATQMIPGVNVHFESGDFVLKFGLFHQVEKLKSVTAKIGGKTKQSTNAYMETVRCGLAALLLKTAKTQAMWAGQSIDLREFANHTICAGANFGELEQEVDSAVKDVTATQTKLIASKIPSLESEIDRDLNRSMQKYQKFQEVSLEDLLVYPSDVSRILIREDATDVSAEEFHQMREQLLAAVDRVYEKDAFFTRTLNPWNEPELQAILNRIPECNLPMLPGKSEITEVLNRADKISFAISVNTFLSQSPLPFSSIPKGELSEILAESLVQIRFYSLLSALESYLNRYEQTSAPITEDIVFSLAPEIRAAWDTIARRRGLHQYANQTVQKAINVSANSNTLPGQADAFEPSLRQYAQQLTQFERLRETPEELPFVSSILSQYFIRDAGQLSTANRDIMETLLTTASWSTQKYLWSLIQKDLISDQKKKGYTCESGTARKTFDFIRTFLSQKPAAQKTLLRQECERMTAVASLMGFDLKHEPVKLGEILTRFKDRYSGGEVETFLDFYFGYLRSGVIAEGRILDYKVQFQGQNLPLYKALPLVAEGEAGPLIRKALASALPFVREQLAHVLRASQPKDLGSIITHTKLINEVLGEQNVEKFIDEHSPNFGADLIEPSSTVLVHLIKEHKTVQARLVSALSDQDLLVDGIYANAYKASGWLVAGWVAKGLFSLRIVPRFTLLPMVGRGLQAAADSMRPLITGYWQALGGAIVGHFFFMHSRVGHYDAEEQMLNGLLYLDPLASEDNAHFKYENFLNQRLFIEFKQKDARDQRFWDAAIGGFIVGAYGAKYIAQAWRSPLVQNKVPYSLHSGSRKVGQGWKNISQNKSTDAAWSGLSKFRIAGLKRNMEYARKILGARNYEVSELQSALLRIERTGTAREISRARTAYLRIINRLGERVYGALGNPARERVVTDAIYGKNASTQNLRQLVVEYERILEKGAPVW